MPDRTRSARARGKTTNLVARTLARLVRIAARWPQSPHAQGSPEVGWPRVEQLQLLPAAVAQALRPLLEQVEALTEKIRACDERIEQIAREQYPETELLQQVSGVGTLIALTFVLTVGDPDRFQKSRDVGCYVGLRLRRSESGESQPQLGISKEGDIYLRKMLVQGAHYILGQRVAARTPRRERLWRWRGNWGFCCTDYWVTGEV